MLVCNSFDLWQKDTFFSAAEEVQQSADIMESAYRRWIRERKEGSGSGSECLDEVSRELQMAFSTAKWQLEEFERAVRLSYRNRGDEITMTRHRQFVSVLENQISDVEAALKNREKKEAQRLNEKECDEFALFLSTTPHPDPDEAGSSVKFNDVAEHQTRIQIVIECKDKAINHHHPIDTQTPPSKDKWSKTGFWSRQQLSQYKDDPQAQRKEKERMISSTSRRMNELLRRIGGSERRILHPFGFSIRFMLLLMLTIFLVVPFLFLRST